MIIWLNGTYGVGKTTVARKIGELLDTEIEILESDYYYQEMVKENMLLAFGGTLPQNNKNFLKRFKKVIEEKLENTNKQLVIVMALTQKEGVELLFEHFNLKGNVLHIILTASEETIKSRINSDDNRERGFAIEWLKYNLAFLDANFPDAIRIDTENEDADAIANEIISHLNI